jgi:hypothetical protein
VGAAEIDAVAYRCAEQSVAEAQRPWHTPAPV